MLAARAGGPAVVPHAEGGAGGRGAERAGRLTAPAAVAAAPRAARARALALVDRVAAPRPRRTPPTRHHPAPRASPARRLTSLILCPHSTCSAVSFTNHGSSSERTRLLLANAFYLGGVTMILSSSILFIQSCSSKLASLARQQRKRPNDLCL